MAHHSSNPYGGGFALKMGLMGAITGGLKFQLDQFIAQQAQEAEIQKEQRLAQLQQQIKVQDEARANDEWTRRTGVDQSNAIALADHNDANLTAREDRNFGHDVQKIGIENSATMSREQFMEAQRHQHELDQQDHEAALNRQKTVFDGTYEAYMNAKGYGKNGGSDGIYGSDGKWYPKGTPLPANVTPAVGFGATNLGTRGSDKAGYTSARTGGVKVTPSGPAAPAAPAQSPHPDGTKLRGPDGRIYVVRNGVPVPL